MKTKNNLHKKTLTVSSLYRASVKCFIFIAIIFIAVPRSVQAQTSEFSKPSWWFGAAAGANFNFYRGSTQKLNSDLTAPVPFHNGFGLGLYAAPLVEFHRPDTRWGVMFQAGYDSKKGTFKEVVSPCNCPRDLSTKISYITIEPSLRFAPFKSNLYLFAGPRVAFNIEKSFIYKQKTNPDYSDQVAEQDTKGNLSDVNQTLISMQIGAGYDIPLSDKKKQTQFVLSPFISFQPYFGQSPRSIETWNITTVRAGAAFKFGRGHKISAVPLVVEPETPSQNTTADALVVFFVNAPTNIPVQRRVRETFPLRNYIFFNQGSTEIPSRYVLLKKSEVKDFKEDQLEVFKPKTLSGRSERQMIAYYNVLNIIGDRMQKKPTTTITLEGSSDEGTSEKSIADGKSMAESVKQYLVTVFEIAPNRITTVGLDKPKNPSEKPGGKNELALLREGDRRVTIVTASPTLLLEFQSGPDEILKPVEIIAIQEAPIDSYVTFNAQGGKEAFKSWSIEIKDEKGAIQNFGPYHEEKISIPGKSILGTRPEGDYKVTMIGTDKKGKEVRKETSVHMVLWTPPKDEEGMRYSVIFDFNKSGITPANEKYLSDVVTPKVPQNGTVIIHGYTDVIGGEEYNKNLSVARANDVKAILEKSLANSGRTDVKFETYAFGEDEKLSQFENKLPEERFYNRSVVIDIIPQK